MALNGVISSGKLFGVILGSGFGTRQKALTNHNLNLGARPKPMLPVGNRVLVDFSIDALKTLGLQDIYCGACPRPLSEIMERHITNRSVYQIDIHVKVESKLLDTAGTLLYNIENLDVKPDSTVCSLNNDNPHNIDLNPIYQAHLKSGAAVTVGALPIKWSSTEWKERTFGTIKLAGMPDIQKYSDRNSFEEDVRAFALENEKQSLKVIGYDEEQERDHARSNLINTGIYFLRGDLLMALSPYITPMEATNRFSDFGLHIFPLLAGRHDEFARHLDPSFIEKIKQGNFPFYAYLLPVDTYWRDAGNPQVLLRANMDVLGRKLDLSMDPRFWQKKDWGWQGNFGSSIHEGAITSPTPETMGSLVGSHVVVDKGAKVEHSVIMDHNFIAGEVISSVILAGTLERGGHIGKGVKLVNSIYAGGKINYSDAPRTIKDSIVYETVYGGLAFDPL